MNPLAPFLDRQGVVVLDGGLATALEARGCELDDDLWSARLLIDGPDAIRQVHDDYLVAGADCLTSASYQATFEAFARRGLSASAAEDLMRLSVDLAVEARDAFWHDLENRPGRLRPLVAASVGPYGAFLANGAEYTGDYRLDEAGLVAFHRRRFEALASSSADLLACETIPSRREARALRRLLDEASDTLAWLSFSCRDDEHLSDGSELEATVAELEDCGGIVAVGVNCTAPRYITGLIQRLRNVTEKPVVVYPNSGEGYDAVAKTWLDVAEPIDFGEASARWVQAGACLVGGCCRTGPRHIRQVRERLLSHSYQLR